MNKKTRFKIIVISGILASVFLLASYNCKDYIHYDPRLGHYMTMGVESVKPVEFILAVFCLLVCIYYIIVDFKSYFRKDLK